MENANSRSGKARIARDGLSSQLKLHKVQVKGEALSAAEWAKLEPEIAEVNGLCANRSDNTVRLCLKLSRFRRCLAHGKWIKVIRSGRLELKRSAANDYAGSGDLENVNARFSGLLPHSTTALHLICRCQHPTSTITRMRASTAAVGSRAQD